ncbi:MFS transporter [Corynebacterium gerontici]|uniref:Tetracycline resistance protein, class B n=1 Tax=Corynebacterium gerontici TaxID=2079234 RepID=A0A3G6IZU7_9CORY|nr:MFS transporter [Corynebacterium gerontici]AZA11186.1 Tetracycline resistance protein, class B [Corynebacterium gerontici]
MIRQASSPRPKIPHEIWILVSAAFIIAIGFGIIAPIIPQFAASFGVGMALAGAVVSIFASTRLIFAPVSGSLIDAIGARKIYLSGLFTVAIATGLVAFSQAYWQILVLRAIAGFGSTMFTVSAMGLIIKLSPPEIRGRSSSAYASGFLFGNILGPVIGGALASLGMRIPFLIYGATVLLAAMVVWWRMPKNIGAVQKGAEKLPSMRFAEAFQDHAYRATLTSGFANGWSNFGARVAVLPLFTAATFSNGSAVAGFALTAFAAGNAFALQFSGRLADSIGRKPVLMTGLLINGVFTAALGLSHAVPILLGTSAAAGAGAGFLNPAQQAVLADVVGTEKSGGKVLANFQMAQDFGAILAPILVGLVAQHLGFQIAFALCGAVSAAAFVAWIFGRETLR